MIDSRFVMKHLLTKATTALMFGCLAARPAIADPIVVSGVFFADTIHAGDPATALVHYDLTGDRGFSLTGTLSSTTGAFVPLLCLPCNVDGGRLLSASGMLGT